MSLHCAGSLGSVTRKQTSVLLFCVFYSSGKDTLTDLIINCLFIERYSQGKGLSSTIAHLKRARYREILLPVAQAGLWLEATWWLGVAKEKL